MRPVVMAKSPFEVWTIFQQFVNSGCTDRTVVDSVTDEELESALILLGRPDLNMDYKQAMEYEQNQHQTKEQREYDKAVRKHDRLVGFGYRILATIIAIIIVTIIVTIIV